MDTASLIDIICTDAGIDGTAGSEDRATALSAINRAFRKVSMVTNGFPDITRYTTTFRDSDLLGSSENTALVSAADGDDSLFYDSISELVSIDWIGVSDTTAATEISSMLEQVPVSRLMQLRPGSASATDSPSRYAMNWPMLMLDSVPSSGVNLVIGFRRMPINLTDDSSSFPYELHPMFREELLAKLAVVIVLEGQEGREQDAAYHRNIWNGTLADYKFWLLRNAGIDYPNDGTRIDAWSVPNPSATR